MRQVVSGQNSQSQLIPLAKGKQLNFSIRSAAARAVIAIQERIKSEK